MTPHPVPRDPQLPVNPLCEENCPCPRTCPRHGDCFACVANHRDVTKKPPFCFKNL